MQHRCDVVGILDAAGLHEARQEPLNVVMVRFCPSQLRGQCTVRARSEHVFGLLDGETARL